MPRTSATVPPETPGTMSAEPMQNPRTACSTIFFIGETVVGRTCGHGRPSLAEAVGAQGDEERVVTSEHGGSRGASHGLRGLDAVAALAGASHEVGHLGVSANGRCAVGGEGAKARL